MKKVLVAVLVSSTFGLAADALAQQRPAAPPADRPAVDRPAERRDVGPAFTVPAGTWTSDKIVGTKVKDAQGKDIGEIDALLIEKDGKVSHVVIGKGGVLGIGEEKVVVPWSDVTMTADRDGDRVAVTMDQSKLQNAPRYRERERAPAASPGTAPAQRR